MNWITENIAIGNHKETQDTKLLKEEKIEAILSLDGSLKSIECKKLGVKKIEVCQLIDGAGNDFRRFSLAIFILEELAEDYSRVLVQCHAGRSRSVTVVAGYLVKVEKFDVEKALEKITAVRETAIAPELMDLLYLV